MSTTAVRTLTRWCAIAAAAIVSTYAGYVAATWLRYGHTADAPPDQRDLTLDQFMPAYDIVERHHIRVHAPAETTFATATDLDLMQSPISRAIFKGRELILGSEPDTVSRPRGLLAFTKSIGWGVLAENPSRQIVMGAVTQPWQANVVFQPLPPSDFLEFDRPGFVKIAWTLRVEPVSANESIFLTETRAIATDASARRKFRRYWALLSPGIIVIRWAMLEPLKIEAEGRASATDLVKTHHAASNFMPRGDRVEYSRCASD
jgi:hypothetical protein